MRSSKLATERASLHSTLAAGHARTRRGPVIAAVMASMAMVAVEATIVATAMPQLVADLGGIALYGWVFAAFLLTQTAATVVFGKLSDGLGRRRVMLWGIAIFLVGSMLCGFARSMIAMIAFRLVQGVGAGAVQPIGLTIVADLYPGAERGRIQGWLASVWAISAVLGPIVGALIVRDLSWSWIFWMNIPIGLAAAAGFILFLHEEIEPRPMRVDWLGTLLFTGTVAALMIALTQAGDLDLPGTAIAAGACAAGAILFVVQERRAADPVISFALWRRRAILATNGVCLLASMALMGLTSFLPMFVQGVMGQSPVTAGLTLTVMLVGWPAGATLAARSYPRLGLKRVLVAGAALIPAGAVAFVLLGRGSSPYLAGAGSLIMGFGMGLASIASLVIVQDSVGWEDRGSATASNMFARNLGSALGATMLGAVLALGLNGRAGGAAATPATLQRMFATGSHPSALAARALSAALQHPLHLTFVAMLAIALATLAAAALVPSGVGAAPPHAST